MRIVFTVLAASAAWWATTVSGVDAQSAQPSKPDPYQCAVAYSAAGKERARVAKPGGSESLVPLVADVPQAHEFDRRAYALDAAIKAQSGRSSLAAARESNEDAAEMGSEGLFILYNLTQGKTDVFPRSRQIFGRVRACDQAYGFTPVVGAPPSAEAIVAHYKARSDREEQARTDRFAALDDRQCIARFLLLGSAMPNDKPFQQIMAQKMDVAGAKAMAADPSLTRARLLELVQRAGTERGSRVKTADDLKLVMEEANACERRYGMPLTQAGAAK